MRIRGQTSISVLGRWKLRARPGGASGLILAVLISTLAWAQVSGPRFRADGWHANEFGRAEGYPVGRGQNRQQPKFLVGSYSRGDTLVPARFIRDVATSSDFAPLGRAAQEPAIHYTSPSGLHSLDDYLDQFPTTGLLIAQGSDILVERYQYDRRETDRFVGNSMTKTITALLVGIAVHEGRIHSIADTAETYVAALRGSEFGRTPIKALLQMSSGIAFKREYQGDTPVGDVAIQSKSAGALDFLLHFNQRDAPPGTRFNYSNADNLALGLVLTGAVGGTIADYARQKLWEPLGAEAKATWELDRSGQEGTNCCFSATLRDWARLGLMLAHDGEWRGRQIVPREWLTAATTVAPADGHLRPKVAAPYFGYGYQVWLHPDPGRIFALLGLRGQAVFVDPGTKTVMVHTAVTHVDDHDVPINGLWNGVVRSLR
jgi:CubicO group peptidase (beta-lactamase class C family)